ncbi:class D sortase [Bacillaceae bacterium Marseille-Q3522]|nr:class D sortase [Bacillaceae bacterium Marseille-Q3522]
MKKFAALLMIAGICIVGYSVFKILDSNRMQVEALEEAKSKVGDNQKEATLSVEEFDPQIGDAIGVLTIPKIDAELPIIEGTDPDELEKGVGHYRDSAFPDENKQIVLSGHRDTVFRKAGQLDIGDELIVQLPTGRYTYVIESTKIVPADDLTVIQPESTGERLTLTTCYPFSYVGNAPDRYIINALPKE